MKLKNLGEGQQKMNPYSTGKLSKLTVRYTLNHYCMPPLIHAIKSTIFKENAA